MAQFLLSVWHDEDYEVDFSGEEMQRIGAQVGAFNEALEASGSYVFANGLQPRSSATTIRFADGDTTLTDGPYAESKEHMGGFWVIDVPDFETALDWAKRGSMACEGPVELRPFQGE
jgi:hypothetical protein